MKDKVIAKQLLVPTIAKEMEKIGYTQYKNTPIFYRNEVNNFGHSYRITHPIPDIAVNSNILYDEWVVKLHLQYTTDIDMEALSQNWTYYWVQLKNNQLLDDYLTLILLSFYTQIGYYSKIKKIVKKINREETLNILYR